VTLGEVASLAQVVCSVVVASVLIYAGASKVRNPGPVTSTLAQLLPRLSPGRGAGRSLGWTEIACAFLLALRVPVLAPITLGALSLAFAWAGVIGLRRDVPILCHCFQGARSALGARQIFIASPMLLLAIGTFLHPFTGTLERSLVALASANFIGAGLAATNMWRARQSAIRQGSLIFRKAESFS